QTGQISRFTNLSPTDFIVANRFMANAQWQHTWSAGAVTQGNVYGFRRTGNLNQGPSGFLEGDEGDQREQIDHRWHTGARLAPTGVSSLLGIQIANALGAQVRHDAIGATVNREENRQFIAFVSAATIAETDVGIFYQNQVQWSGKVRTVLGLR